MLFCIYVWNWTLAPHLTWWLFHSTRLVQENLPVVNELRCRFDDFHFVPQSLVGLGPMLPDL